MRLKSKNLEHSYEQHATYQLASASEGDLDYPEDFILELARECDQLTALIIASNVDLEDLQDEVHQLQDQLSDMESKLERLKGTSDWEDVCKEHQSSYKAQLWPDEDEPQGHVVPGKIIETKKILRSTE